MSKSIERILNILETVDFPSPSTVILETIVHFGECTYPFAELESYFILFDDHCSRHTKMTQTAEV